jgi:hypothetical protein
MGSLEKGCILWYHDESQTAQIAWRFSYIFLCRIGDRCPDSVNGNPKAHNSRAQDEPGTAATLDSKKSNI